MTVLRNATVTVKFCESFSLIVVSGKTMLADVTGIKTAPKITRLKVKIEHVLQK